MAMTRSGLSLEELRIVEGQGQSSEVITPSEELNRINDMGTAAGPELERALNVVVMEIEWRFARE